MLHLMPFVRQRSAILRRRLAISLLCTTALISIGYDVYAICSPHDHHCRFHSIGRQADHAGTQHAHHTKGRQITPSIPTTDAGLYFYAIWDDNASGQQADLDIDVLLPEYTKDNNDQTISAGPYVVSNNAALGGAPSQVDIFEQAGIANTDDRHVDTFQYQITYFNNTATALHSEDANGIAPIPNAKPCIYDDLADSCEHIQITGNVPTGIYQAGVTNFDVHNLSDPSTPSYTIGVELVTGDNEINGDYYHLSHVAEEVVEGEINDKGETSEILVIGFDHHDFDPHAEGVVIDQYVEDYYSKLKYANPRDVRDGYVVTTVQDTYRDYWGYQAYDVIGASGQIEESQIDKSHYAYRRNNVYQGTNFVGREVDLSGLTNGQYSHVFQKYGSLDGMPVAKVNILINSALEEKVKKEYGPFLIPSVNSQSNDEFWGIVREQARFALGEEAISTVQPSFERSFRTSFYRWDKSKGHSLLTASKNTPKLLFNNIKNNPVKFTKEVSKGVVLGVTAEYGKKHARDYYGYREGSWQDVTVDTTVDGALIATATWGNPVLGTSLFSANQTYKAVDSGIRLNDELDKSNNEFDNFLEVHDNSFFKVLNNESLSVQKKHKLLNDILDSKKTITETYIDLNSGLGAYLSNGYDSHLRRNELKSQLELIDYQKKAIDNVFK